MATGDLTRIRTNIAALNALNSLKSINSKINVHQLRLATGKRINQSVLRSKRGKQQICLRDSDRACFFLHQRNELVVDVVWSWQ